VKIFLTFALALILMPLSASAQDFTAAQKETINAMIESYLLENGDKVLKSVNTYQENLAQKQQEAAAARAKDFLNTIEDGAEMPMAGNPDGDITVVEFFDYNCGYCRKALEEIQTVLGEDENVKIIFMDMPILGASSREASKWSLAAMKQGKYFEYHQAIMNHDGEKSEKALMDLAKDVGLDIKKLKKDVTSADIEKMIERNLEQAAELNIRGTPGFIVGGQIFPGYIPAEQMLQIIEEKRG